MRVLVVALASLLAAATAHAECPESDAGCVLQKEGAEALAAKDYAKARAKFDASLATAPSARGYLGLATADEALGDVAAAYENVVDAKRLSDAELAERPNEVDVKARAERIKYLIGDLRARVGLDYLRMPGNEPPYRLVSVQRKGAGNVPDPLRRPIAVAPDQQALAIVLDDGSQSDMFVQVPAGRDATYVIPADRFAVHFLPPPPPLPLPPRPELLKAYSVGIEGTIVSGYSDESTGYGLLASYGYRINPRLMLTIRAGYFTHPSSTNFGLSNEPTTSSFEIPGLVGARYHFADHFYVFAEGGYIFYDRSVSQTMSPGGPTIAGTDEEFGIVCGTLGAGVHSGRFELDLNGLWSTGGPDDSTRVMLTARIRLSP